MKSIRFFTSLILIIWLSIVALAQGKLDYLNTWVGMFPTYNDRRPRQQFLKLPVIQRGLKKLLSEADYRFVTKTCRKEVPIERIENYLIVRRCHSYACAYGAMTLVINLDDGAMHIAILDEDDQEQRWFSTNNKQGELPFEVKSAWYVNRKRA
jgi:hypothetical protein